MKHLTFQLAKNQTEWVFKPIRTKLDAINVLMRIIKIMLTYHEPAPAQIAGHFSLNVDAMSRLVFVSKNKIYSLNFPFRVGVGEQGGIRFYDHYQQDIDNKLTSSILEFIYEHSIFAEASVLDFAAPVVNSNGIERDLWALLRELLLWEEGYIRYDDDPANVQGAIHPRYHLDVFYSSAATFKLGLKEAIEHTMFSDILNINTDCRFL